VLIAVSLVKMMVILVIVIKVEIFVVIEIVNHYQHYFN